MSRTYHEAIRDMSHVMVKIKNPSRLLKIITRYLYREMNISSVAIAVFDEKRKRYVFYDSQGSRRIPKSLVKIDHDNPLITWFSRKDARRVPAHDYLTLPRIDELLATEVRENHNERHCLRLTKMKAVMQNIGACACFPGYHKRDLLGILFVGEKVDEAPFTDEELMFLQVVASDASMSLMSAWYQRALEEKVTDLEVSLSIIRGMRNKDKGKYLQTIITLANAVDAKDPYTCGHGEEVERWGMLTVGEMDVHFDNDRCDLLRCALRLHDFGKLGVPDQILNKEGKLTIEEWIKMKDHVKIGARILEEHDDFKEVAKIILHHHENFDGSGYPFGLKEEEIPLEARIIAVVDSFHAMISDRPYRKGMSYDDAIAELKKHAGRQFDQHVVDAFLRVLEKSIRIES